MYHNINVLCFALYNVGHIAVIDMISLHYPTVNNVLPHTDHVLVHRIRVRQLPSENQCHEKTYSSS